MVTLGHARMFLVGALPYWSICIRLWFSSLYRETILGSLFWLAILQGFQGVVGAVCWLFYEMDQINYGD
jgi:hypothetical protein